MNEDRERLLDRWIEDSLRGREPQPGSVEPGSVDAERADIDRAAAALHLGLIAGRTEPLPDDVRAKLARHGRDFAARRRGEHAAAVAAGPQAGARRGDLVPSPRSSAPVTWLAWMAAAASLLFALWTWSVNRPASTEPVVASAAERRALLLASAGDVLRLDWSATPDPAAQGTSGEVVWSDAAQEGYMTFRSLAANDPSREQYQLWIFDPERPDETPVDGGVFDVPATGGEVVVPIDAKLGVHRPKLFAVTVEKPGGVVVSKRERIVVLAQRG